MCIKTRFKCCCRVLFVFLLFILQWCHKCLIFFSHWMHTHRYIKKKSHRHRRSLDTLLSSYKRSAWERKGQSVTYDKGHHQTKKQHFSRPPGALHPEESGKAATQIAPDSCRGDSSPVSVCTHQRKTSVGAETDRNDGSNAAGHQILFELGLCTVWLIFVCTPTHLWRCSWSELWWWNSMFSFWLWPKPATVFIHVQCLAYKYKAPDTQVPLSETSMFMIPMDITVKQEIRTCYFQRNDFSRQSFLLLQQLLGMNNVGCCLIS